MAVPIAPMTAAALPRDAFMPSPPEGLRRPLLLALGAHGLLVIALAISVNWRSHEPEGVQAELWAAVPQISGQRAELPPPPPPRTAAKPPPAPPKEVREEPKARDAQIAIEKDKARKEREKKLQEQKELEKEREKQKKLKQAEAEKQRETDKKKSAEQARAAEQTRADAEREKNLQDIMRKAGGTSGSGQAAQTAGPSASYAGRIKAAVRPNITFVQEIKSNPAAEVEVRAAADGAIVSSKLVKSSGNAAWDDAVLNAIEKTAKLPRDENGKVPSPMILSFKPNDL